MSYSLDPMEHEMVVARCADDRYDYFVDKVALWGQVWSLSCGDGWVVVSVDDDECLPVWPHPDLAADWATGDWADCHPEAIALETWLQRWTPGMSEDGTLVAVFPNDQEEGVVTTPGELAESLKAAR